MDKLLSWIISIKFLCQIAVPFAQLVSRQIKVPSFCLRTANTFEVHRSKELLKIYITILVFEIISGHINAFFILFVPEGINHPQYEFPGLKLRLIGSLRNKLQNFMNENPLYCCHLVNVCQLPKQFGIKNSKVYFFSRKIIFISFNGLHEFKNVLLLEKSEHSNGFD